MKKLLLLMFSATLIFMFSVSAIAQQGKTVKVANNQELIEAKNNPNIQTVVLDDGFYQLYNTYFTQGTIVKFANNASRGGTCDYWIQPEDYCWPTTNAGIARAGTSSPNPLDPCTTTESGIWSYTSTYGILTWTDGDPSSYIENFTVDAPGLYTLTYTWDATSGAPPGTNVSTSYKFYTLPVITQLDAPDACGTTTDVTYSIDYGAYPYACDTVVWSIDGTPLVSAPVGNPWTTPVLPCGAHTVSLTVTQDCAAFPPGPCTVVTDSDPFFLADIPLVYAGDDDTICGLTYTLQPTSSASCWDPGSPTTAWSFISGPGTANWVGDVVTVDPCGTYEFEVEVFNGLCSATDRVTIDFVDEPYNVDAGPDTSICFTSLPFLLTPYYDLDCPNSPTTTWSKVSGPGTVTFTDNDFDATECGDYLLRFTVENYPCPPVSDDVNIYIYDVPDIITSPTTVIPTDICGYLTDDFYLWYTVDCDSSTTPITNWSYTPPSAGATALITSKGTGLWDILVDTCGAWDFNFEVVNGACSEDTTFTINFFQEPDPLIVGSDTVFACGNNDYFIDDLSDCNDLDDLDLLWIVECGLFVNDNDSIYTDGDSTITVYWKNIVGPGRLVVQATIKGITIPDCDGADTLEITKIPPTLAGQVRYWNEFETYMPTPFPTSLYGTFPHDYFYVTLYEGTTCMTAIETVIVEPRLMPDLVELLSYFEFTLPIGIYAGEYDCDAVFTLRIWDGSLWYHQNPPPPPNSPTYLGASYTYNNWGGVNATDGLAIQYMAASTEIHNTPYDYTWVGLTTDSPPYGYYSYPAADVNSTDPFPYTTGGITALDALTANYRAVGLIANYPDNGSANQFSPNFRVTGRMVPSLPFMTWSTYFNYPNVDDVPFLKDNTWDYLYFTDAIDHFYASDPLPWGGENNYINIYYLAIGDLNSSYVPTRKTSWLQTRVMC
jgi:hypothetical protein